MLNNGANAVRVVEVQDEFRPLMEAHQMKKTSRMRALHSWQ